MEVYSETIEVGSEETYCSYTVREGEPEDMIFGRNLEDVSSIEIMIGMAHKAGLEGRSIEFKEIKED